MMPSLDMIQQCAANVAPQTIAAIIRVESGGNQFAVGINGRYKLRRRPRTVGEAIAAAKLLISKGCNVDLGLMQINSRNLRGLGLTIEQAFDPRFNIQAGARILCRGYGGAVKRFGPGQMALKAALSAYNTGNYERGFRNGYVAKYFRGGTSDGIASLRIPISLTASRAVSPKFMAARQGNPYGAELNVYATAAQALAEPMSPVQLASAAELQITDEYAVNCEGK